MLNTSWSKRLSHGWGVIDVFVFNVSIFSKENNFHVMYSWNMFVWRRLSCTSSGLHLAFVRLEDKILSIYYVNSCTIYAVFENSFYFSLNSMDLYIYTSLYWERTWPHFGMSCAWEKVSTFLLKKTTKMGNHNQKIKPFIQRSRVALVQGDCQCLDTLRTEVDQKLDVLFQRWVWGFHQGFSHVVRKFVVLIFKLTNDATRMWCFIKLKIGRASCRERV